MEVLLPRALMCPFFLVILLITPFASAVDPVDFLESLKDDEDSNQHRDSTSTEYPNGVNVIPGDPDVNYPVLASIPKSAFSCIGRPVGFYADTELRCQVWHICDEDRRQQSFLCTNGTVYSQEKRVCDWWYNVNCDPSEVSRNYLQNYDLYKEAPSKSDNNNQDQNNSNHNKNNNSNYNRNNGNDDRNNDNDNKQNGNDFDYQPTTKSYKDPFAQFPSSRQKSESQHKQRFNDDQQNTKPTPSYNEPFSSRGDSTYSNNNNNNNNDFSSPRRQPSSSQSPQRHTTTTSTTTYRPPSAYNNNNTPPPPAALQGNSFPPKATQQRQLTQAQYQQKPQQKSQQQQHQQQSDPPRSQPSIKTTNTGGKRIVEIRVPISQIPPEILAKYGKRIPELILKEIFLNFTRNQQQELQKEAISSVKPNSTSSSPSSRPPNAPIPPQNRHSNSPPPPPPKSTPVSQNRHPHSPPPKSAPVSQNRHSNSPPPPPQPSSKKPVEFNENNNNNPSSFSGNSKPNNSPPPPPPPAEYQYKFRHSTPRKVDNVKFATPTRELLAEYEDERQQVGESQNPIYSLQNLFSSQHSSRNSAKSKAPPANEVGRVKESYNYETTTTTTYQPPQQQQQQQQYQDFTRPPPRRRTQPPTTAAPAYYTTTTEEPQLITDRYFPVATREEKRNAEIRRIFLIAKQGVKVLPPIPVLAESAAVEVPTARRAPPPPTKRPQFRTTPVHEFSKIPPPPKVAIPEDYYVKNERFEEAESRYPRPSLPSFIEPQQFQQRQYSRPATPSIPSTTTTTTTTTTTQTPPTSPRFQEQEFRRTKPNKPNQNKIKKATTLSPVEKQEEDNPDYDSNQDRVNQDELELLRLAQEYIDLTGQDFGSRQTPRNA